jgi:hypothetical protein
MFLCCTAALLHFCQVVLVQVVYTQYSHQTLCSSGSSGLLPAWAQRCSLRKQPSTTLCWPCSGGCRLKRQLMQHVQLHQH